MEMILITKEELRILVAEECSRAFNRGFSVLNKAETNKEAAPIKDEFLTPRETADLLKVSTVTVWDWSKRGILNKHTIGNKVLYLSSEVVQTLLNSSSKKSK